ncbi:hypothetical protein PENTCL1PPCAC_7187 [Pristionchus entomophagus]|uniref:Uncharacterized protein n=1 Tax=Pristionchus entomophagus TaxID=358040 RepID=A0AAV5SQE7_9BILA|nr:hypothetical protein PENTCL1PPCAC_7187 [Pristionchus entomophagus]
MIFDLTIDLSSLIRIGIITDRSGTLTVDPSIIVVCDIESSSISIERSKPDEQTNFPYTKDGEHPYDCRSYTIFLSQLGLIVSHCCPANSWRRIVEAVTERLASMGSHSLIEFRDCSLSRTSHKFLTFSIFLGLLKFKILRPPGARIGLMDIRTLQWRE